MTDLVPESALNPVTSPLLNHNGTLVNGAHVDDNKPVVSPVNSTKPKSDKPKSTKPPRSPSPSPPPIPPRPPLQTIRLEIKLGGPDNYEVDLAALAKSTGQRPPTPVPVKRDTSDSEGEGEGEDEGKDQPKDKKKRVSIVSSRYRRSTLSIRS
jgi:hypothetical protein